MSRYGRNTQEVLSIYAIKVNTDPEDPHEVASMNVFKSEILKDIFWDMNEITYHTETKKEKVKEEKVDEDGNIEEGGKEGYKDNTLYREHSQDS